MTVTLNIPAMLENAVQANAQAKGLSVENYLLTLVERNVIAPPPGSENWTLQDALDYEALSHTERPLENVGVRDEDRVFSRRLA